MPGGLGVWVPSQKDLTYGGGLLALGGDEPPGTEIPLQDVREDLRFWPGELVATINGLVTEPIVPVLSGPYMWGKFGQENCQDVYYEVKNAFPDFGHCSRLFLLAKTLIPTASTLLVRKFRKQGRLCG